MYGHKLLLSASFAPRIFCVEMPTRNNHQTQHNRSFADSYGFESMDKAPLFCARTIPSLGIALYIIGAFLGVSSYAGLVVGQASLNTNSTFVVGSWRVLQSITNPNGELPVEQGAVSHCFLDVNQDDILDLIVGAVPPFGPEPDNARIFVYLGDGNGGFEDPIDTSTDHGFPQSLINNTVLFAVTMECFMKADGTPVLLVGAPISPPWGSFFIVFLDPNNAGHVVSWVEHGGFASDVGGLLTPGLSINFGHGLQVLGDWDEDGMPEVLVSDASAQNTDHACFVLSLHPDGTLKNASALQLGTVPELLWPGAGTALTVLGDVDGDGVDDLGIAAAGFGKHYRNVQLNLQLTLLSTPPT
ncbi:hypothetical protein QOT17_022612 [Balamuthia mandrillaris]